MSDWFRDPLGWLLDSLPWPWPLRKRYLAIRLHEKPSDVPDACRIIGFRRPPEYVFEYFNKLEELDQESEAAK